ncbi:MAG: biotin carboxylase, partial [Anaerolineae bacterium]|nr:biotin carboxylase [Anaerolineae bacterium]
LRISSAGDYQYDGADLGILVTRGRLMTDDFQLTDRAKAWIAGIRAKFEAVAPTEIQPVPEIPAEIGGFKML